MRSFNYLRIFIGFLFMFFFFISFCFAQFSIFTPPGQLTTEEDGVPDLRCIKYKLTNTTVTDNGDGTCSLNTSGTTTTGWTDDGTVVRLTTTSDNVGIGTTSVYAGAKVDVRGGDLILDNSQYIKFRDSGGTPRKMFYLGGADNAVFGTTTINDVLFDVGSISSALAVKGTTGRVGVYTSSPQAQLHVVQVSSADSFRVDDVASDTTPFVIDQSGKVGVGQPSPQHILSFARGANTVGVGIGQEESACELSNSSSESIASGYPRRTGIYFANDSETNNARYAGISGIVTGSSAGGRIGAIIFSVKSSVSATELTEMMRLTKDGRFGIKTTSPSADFDVGGGSLTYADGTDDILVKGDVEVDGNIYGVHANEPDFIEKSLENPSDSDSLLIFKAPRALTITDIDCIVDPADSGESVVIDIQECDATGDSCVTTDATITCDNDGAADDGTFTNGSIDSGDWINLDIGIVTGTVSWLTLTVNFTSSK